MKHLVRETGRRIAACWRPLFLSMALVACGPDEAAEDAALDGQIADAAGQGDADARLVDGSDSAPDAGGPSARQRLESCYADFRCKGSSADYIEGVRLINEAKAKCVLEALRDRTPGLYNFRVSSVRSYGEPTTVTENVFAILDDGTALTVSTSSTGSDSTAMRCNLGPRSHFDQCLAALDDPGVKVDSFPEGLDPAWSCTADGIGWFEDCVSESPEGCDGPADIGSDAGC